MFEHVDSNLSYSSGLGSQSRLSSRCPTSRTWDCYEPLSISSKSTFWWNESETHELILLETMVFENWEYKWLSAVYRFWQCLQTQLSNMAGNGLCIENKNNLELLWLEMRPGQQTISVKSQGGTILDSAGYMISATLVIQNVLWYKTVTENI